MKTRLARHAIVQTRRLDELIGAYAQIYAEPKFRIADRNAFGAVITERQIGGVWIGYGRYDGSTEREFPNAERFLYLLPINDAAGSLRTRTYDCVIAPDRPVTISPAAGYHGHYSAAFESLSIMFDGELLTQALESITGMRVSQPLVFEPQMRGPGGWQGSLPAYLRLLIDTLEQADAGALPDWWVAQTEHMLTVLLLCEQPHNYSHLFDLRPSDPSLEQVRRAEAFIEANHNGAITAEDMAQASGVSVFALYRAFKKINGCSPLQFAARLRAQGNRL